jgi:hypothetical protein
MIGGQGQRGFYRPNASGTARVGDSICVLHEDVRKKELQGYRRYFTPAQQLRRWDVS